MRALLTVIALAGAFSTASVGAFKAICDRADRLEQLEARDQMNRVAFSARHAPNP